MDFVVFKELDDFGEAVVVDPCATDVDAFFGKGNLRDGYRFGAGAEYHEAPRRREQIQSVEYALRRADGIGNHVRAFSAGKFHHCRFQIFVFHVDGAGRAHLPRQFEAAVEDVGDQYFGAAGACHFHDRQSRRPGTEYHDFVVCADAGAGVDFRAHGI